MKVLLYFEDENLIAKSGVGRAMQHQKKALESAGISYTTNSKDTDYDILHINTYGVTSQFVVANARKNHKPVIYHAHSTKEDFMNSFVLSNAIAPLVKKRLCDLYNSADLLITPTPYAKHLLEGYGLTMPIYPVSNGVDLSQYEHDNSKIQAFYDYFHLTPKDRIVIGIGLLFQRKGILDFLKVAEMLPEYHFIWFGDISRILIPGKIIRAIDNCPENVEFPGYIIGDVLKGALQAADCFFSPSYEETEGIAVLEALASKQTCILRDIGAYESWAKSGTNCYLGKSNVEFANLIQQVCSKRLPATGNGAYLVAQSRSIDQIGSQLKKIYEIVL